ncbi:B12-binding domain-containing radical SAM protein [Candidatus Pelagibacter ubique]|nr:B12-binding domain-containing radical SAM protein [Candidatus Pelagibacter ubique]
MNNKVTLIRLATVSSASSFNNEAAPAIGLAYLASICKINGVEVEGIDATGLDINSKFDIPEYGLKGQGLDIEDVIKKIDANTDLIGISAMFTYEWLYVRDCIKKIKEKFPYVKIIAGGEHVTALTEYCLNDCSAIDYIALGEGEQTWMEIMMKLNEGSKDFNDIPGLVYKINEKIFRTKPRARIKEIDKLPWPDWETMPIEPYLDSAAGYGPGSGRNMPMLASRGCPYECTFCSNPAMYGRRYEIRDTSCVINEIKHYIKKYRISGIQFYDLTAIVKKSWVIEFCKALKDNGINLDWSLPSGTRSEALDLEVLQALSGVNLKYLVYAPESGSEETLKIIKKKIKLKNLEQSVKYAVSQGMTLRTNLIIGFPHETRMQLYRTLYQQIKFVLMGVEEVPLYIFNAYPGTEIFNSLVHAKKIIVNEEYFISLADSLGGKLSPPKLTFNRTMGRHEIYIYWLIGNLLSYMLVYLTRPKKIFRTIKSLFTDSSSSVIEQRLKDMLRKSNLFNLYLKPFVKFIFFKKKKS